MSETSSLSPENNIAILASTTPIPRTNLEKSALVPKSLDELFKISEFFAKSSFIPVPLRNKPADIAFVISAGAEMGLTPISAINNLSLINGKVSISTAAILGICQNASDWGGLEESCENGVATCIVTRNELKYEASFSLEDAHRAGLTARSGTPWQTYPQVMLATRARNHALKKAFADKLLGFLTDVEATDINDADFDLIKEVPIHLDLSQKGTHATN